MSDGPHRTLSLRQHWKRVAQRADQRAFDADDVVEAMSPALERDWWWEIPKDFMVEIRRLCAYEAPTLFGDELDSLKNITLARGTLGSVLAQCAADALAAGMNGEAAVRQAVKQALHDRLVRNTRSMEEHYLREAGERRAADVRARLANAITRAQGSIDVLADKLMNQPASGKAAPPKHQGLDDGVGIQ